MSAKFVISKSKNDKFLFNLKAGNGEIILTSQQYEAKSSAEHGIDSVRHNAPLDERFERKTSKSGDPFFVLTADNGQTIGQSEMYSSTSAMENGIASVKKNAPEAKLKDLIAS